MPIAPGLLFFKMRRTPRSSRPFFAPMAFPAGSATPSSRMHPPTRHEGRFRQPGRCFPRTCRRGRGLQPHNPGCGRRRTQGQVRARRRWSLRIAGAQASGWGQRGRGGRRCVRGGGAAPARPLPRWRRRATPAADKQRAAAPTRAAHGAPVERRGGMRRVPGPYARDGAEGDGAVAASRRAGQRPQACVAAVWNAASDA